MLLLYLVSRKGGNLLQSEGEVCKQFFGNIIVLYSEGQNSAQVNLDLNLKSWNGWTALHLSCASGQSKIVDVIIENSQQFNIELNAKNHYEMTGFHGGSSLQP